MKADEAQVRAALDRPPADLRFILLHGPDASGAMALAARLERTMGDGAERVDLDGAALKGDPARLAEEAASLSLFGGARHIRVTAMGEESVSAVTMLLEVPRAGNPVVGIAPGVKTTGALVKLALASKLALACACYVPTGRRVEQIASDLARDAGMRIAGDAARRLAVASGGDRAVMAREIEKLALYLDAAPERPATLDDAALDAVGADLGEAEIGRAIAALVGARAGPLGDELARLGEAGVSPVAWLRQLARRLTTLAEIRAEVDEGGDIDGALKRHRIFGNDTAATRAALERWNAAMLVSAHARVRAAERSVMASGNAGGVLADQEAITLVRAAARR